MPAGYTADASGLPMTMPTPPAFPSLPAPPPAAQQISGQQISGQQVSGQMAYSHYPPQSFPPPHQEPPMQGMPAGYAPQGYPLAPTPAMSPGALYQFQPAAQNLSITGQMRLFEVDELPAHYKLGAARKRWFTYIASGTLAVAVAALTTFLVIRTTRDPAPSVGSIFVDSGPAGANVRFDGTLLSQKTPLTIDRVPVGRRHVIRIELAHYEPFEETVDIPARGGEVQVSARLLAVTGKVIVETSPPYAEIWINGELRGRSGAAGAPTTLSIDRDSARSLELRLKDYQPVQRELGPQSWSSDGKLRISVKLSR
jgi:hypothetical protein